MVIDYILYHTLGCHLCDEAELLLSELQWQGYEKVDIADDDELVERYGIRIPVLFHTKTEQALGWPFDAAMATAFIRHCDV